MHEDNIHLQEQTKTIQEKLVKARAVSNNIYIVRRMILTVVV